jgi:chromosomal replication initiator protein
MSTGTPIHGPTATAMRALRLAAHYHDLSVRDLLGDSKRKSICEARFAAWLGVREAMGLSYPELGAMFGRDHTTIMQGCKRAYAGAAEYVARRLVSRLKNHRRRSL